MVKTQILRSFWPETLKISPETLPDLILCEVYCMTEFLREKAREGEKGGVGGKLVVVSTHTTIWLSVHVLWHVNGKYLLPVTQIDSYLLYRDLNVIAGIC